MLKISIFLNKFFLLAILLAGGVGAGIGLYPVETLILITLLLIGLLIFFFPRTSLVWLAFLFPFLPALNLGAGVDLASGRVLILLLFFSWLAHSLANKCFKVPLKIMGLLVILFLVWVAGSYIYSPITERTFRKLLVFYSIFPLFFIGYGMFMEYGKKLVLSVFKAVAVGSIGIILIGIIQFLSQFFWGGQTVAGIYSNYIAPFLWGKTVAVTVASNPSWFFDAGSIDLLRAFATFPDPHMLSYFLAFAIPLLVGIGLFQKKKKLKILYLTSAFMGLVVELLTFSRGGYLGFFSALTFILTILFFSSSNKKLLVEIVGGIGAGLLVLGIIFPVNPIFQRVGSIFNTYEGSNRGRLEIWGEAFNLFKDRPLLGVGLGAYSYEVRPAANYRDPIYAHNLYLEFLAEIGIPGFIFWLGIIVSAIWIFTKNYLKNKKSEMGIISFALGSSLVWFSVHSLFEMPVYSPIILPLLVLTLALASYLEDNLSGGSATSRSL